MTRLRNPYLLEHPLAFLLGVGIFLAGVLLALGVGEDLVVAALPEPTRIAWHLSYSVGGLCLSLGILLGSPRVEGAGLALIAFPFAIQAFLSVDLFGAQGIPGAAFLLALSVGCSVRFLILFHRFSRGANATR